MAVRGVRIHGIIRRKAGSPPGRLPDLIHNRAHRVQRVIRTGEADGCGLMESDSLGGTVTLLNRWLKLMPEQRAAMSEQARRTFEARYNMRTNAAAILRVFEPAQEAR